MEKANKIYWAYVKFNDANGGKTRPVLFIRQSKTDYVVFRLTSKFQNKSKHMQKFYVEVKDWQQANLSKPSWVDVYKTYSLPIKTTKLTFLGTLSKNDFAEVSKYL